jgi:hypothetical protein
MTAIAVALGVMKGASGVDVTQNLHG